MIRLTLLLLVVCLPFAKINAQEEGPEITIYRTYEDFAAKNGRDYQTYLTISGSYGGITLVLSHHNEKERVKCADIWGFRYRDALFRIDHKIDHPAKLMSYGNICYYENGPAHLYMMSKERSKADVVGIRCYVSLDLKDDLFPLSGRKYHAKAAREYFVQKSPMYNSFFDCVGTGLGSDQRHCVSMFEKDHPKED